MKNNNYIIKGAIVVLLLCSSIFLGCAGTNGSNGNDPTDVKKVEGMSNKIWTIEDYPGRYGNLEGLDADTEVQILLDFYNCGSYKHLGSMVQRTHTIDQYMNGWDIVKYYGTYNGYIVVDIDGRLSILGRTAHGYPLAYGFISQGRTKVTPAWKDGKIYSLDDLYDCGELTLENVRDILHQHMSR